MASNRKPTDRAVIRRRVLLSLSEAAQAAYALADMIEGNAPMDDDTFTAAVRKLEAAGCQTRRAKDRGRLT